MKKLDAAPVPRLALAKPEAAAALAARRRDRSAGLAASSHATARR